MDVTLLDTPGHADFSTEMERTLRVLDYAVLVISGTDGIQGHTETLWKLLEQYRIPTFLFINKMIGRGRMPNPCCWSCGTGSMAAASTSDGRRGTSSL